MLGVNGDDDRAKAVETITKESITWPSFWNQGNSGGIVEQYAVRAWPTIYVLDREGIIRYKQVSGKQLDAAVEKLVAEAWAGRE